MCSGGQEGQWHPGLLRNSVASRSREQIISLYSSTVQFRALHYKTDAEALMQRVQKRAVKLVRGLEGKPCEEWLREL